mmetsp:Transcript_25764/g.102862  ORF Transcript_25764/g.102862 Transcript_25764/m.102862 type:complete len:623 (-) Transcript_25764:2651-4519(-)
MRRLESRCSREHGATRLLAYADTNAFAFFSRLGFSRTVTTPFAAWKPKVVDYSLGAVVAEKLILASPHGPSAVVSTVEDSDEDDSSESEEADKKKTTDRPKKRGAHVPALPDSKKRRRPLGSSSSSNPPQTQRDSRALSTGVTRCTSGRKNCYCRSGRTRAILRYDPATGRTLEEYCSTSDAARKLGLTSPQITHVLSGTNEDAKGHKFRYAKEVPWVRTGGPREVVEVDAANPLTVLREWPSAAAASRATGINNSAIGANCAGRQPSAGGRVFRFKEPRVYPCYVCATDHDGESLLLCDGKDGLCPSTAHVACLGLDDVPDGAWYCASCARQRAKDGLPSRDDDAAAARVESSAPPARASSSSADADDSSEEEEEEEDDEEEPLKPPPSSSREKRTAGAASAKRHRPAPRGSSSSGQQPERPKEVDDAAPQQQQQSVVVVERRSARGRLLVPTVRMREATEAAKDADDDAQLQTKRASAEAAKKRKRVEAVPLSFNDDICAACADGGDLLCCDDCPRAFHLACAGLVRIPRGSWSCPACAGPASKKRAPRRTSPTRRLDSIDDDCHAPEVVAHAAAPEDDDAKALDNENVVAGDLKNNSEVSSSSSSVGPRSDVSPVVIPV